MSIHDIGISNLKLKFPKIETESFWKNVRKLTNDYDYGIRDYKFLPDAFILDKEKSEIILFEVEDNSKVTMKKLLNIFMFSDYIANEFEVRLFISDRFGENLIEFNFDLILPSYFNLLQK